MDTFGVAQGARQEVQSLLDRFLGVSDQRLVISLFVRSHSALLSRRRRHTPPAETSRVTANAARARPWRFSLAPRDFGVTALPQSLVPACVVCG